VGRSSEVKKQKPERKEIKIRNRKEKDLPRRTRNGTKHTPTR
jgi:hypothetical protein